MSEWRPLQTQAQFDAAPRERAILIVRWECGAWRRPAVAYRGLSEALFYTSTGSIGLEPHQFWCDLPALPAAPL